MMNAEFDARRLAGLRQKQSGARMAGITLAFFAILLTLAPSSFVDFSIQQKSVAALLAGMFGFTSIEAFRRSF
jgi:hypothetical protein